MNIQVVRENSLGINRGIYADWMGNALSDGNANTLIAEGAAVTVNYKNPYLNEALSPAQISNADINGVAGVGDGKLFDENGDEIIVASDPSSKVSNSLSGSEQYVDVTEKLYVTQDATATTAALRLKYQSDTRTELIIRNPPSNTATIRIGLKDSDNVTDANGSFATAYTIAPGRQRRLTFDRRQVFIKQDQAGLIADQFVIVTERQAIS